MSTGRWVFITRYQGWDLVIGDTHTAGIRPAIGPRPFVWWLFGFPDVAGSAATRQAAQRAVRRALRRCASGIGFGARVTVRAVYKRQTVYQRRHNDKSWEPLAIEPRTGLYIGTRTLSNGKTRFDEGYEFTPERSFRAALVVFSERERPVLVPFDALTVQREGGLLC